MVQNVEITLINGHYTKRVADFETREGCPITPGSSLTKTFTLTPSLNGNKDVRGIALDGFLKVYSIFQPQPPPLSLLHQRIALQ